MIVDFFKSDYFGEFSIYVTIDGMGILNKEKQTVIYPFFDKIIRPPMSTEITFYLGNEKYYCPVDYIKNNERFDTLHFFKKTASCENCKGYGLLYEEVEVYGTGVVTTTRTEQKEYTGNLVVTKVTLTEKKRKARDGYQWQQRKCRYCDGIGKINAAAILILDQGLKTYREL